MTSGEKTKLRSLATLQFTIEAEGMSPPELHPLCNRSLKSKCRFDASMVPVYSKHYDHPLSETDRAMIASSVRIIAHKLLGLRRPKG